MELQKSLNIKKKEKKNLQQNRAERITLPDFRLY